MMVSASCYLDYNAGAPARPEVVAAMAEALAEAGNPSSVHGAGRRARQRIEAARMAVADLVSGRPDGVVFTSGGTEANVLTLRGRGERRVLISAIEHASVAANVPEADILPVDGDGVLDLAALEARLAGNDGPALVSVMLANNETGVIQPVSEAAAIAHRHGALLHCDAAQGAGRMALSMERLGVDLLTLSAHKMGGPAGIGALVLADPDRAPAPLLKGGGQERGRRAGTENISGIVGFGWAAHLAKADGEDQITILSMRDMRDRLEEAALRRVPAAIVIGKGADRLANTSCLALPGVANQTQVMALDLAGVMVGAGAACSSGKMAASRVLAAMGLEPALAGSAIRVSLGWGSTETDVAEFLRAWADLARRKGLDVHGAANAA
jgi:cysteine desulfurase